MYVEFFGLKHSPFRARASGSDVFVGPQQAKLMSGLKKALTERDAVVSVSGPVGVGKTISAARSLDAVTTSQTTARIGRMQLGREEILELLLIEFNLADQAQTTPQRFGAFRGLLNDKEDENERIFIVVEDACRIGVEGLAELESLTSADSGDSSGANIILLGPPDFETFIKTPQLARLRQRIRLRHKLNPYTPAEVRGYVAHRLREAGGDIEAIFAAEAINTLHRCAEGIPRMINSLANAAMTAAADANADQVSAELLARIAREDFGVDPAGVQEATPALTDAAAGSTAPDDAAAPARTPPPDALELPDDIDIPEFIQDTMPEIEALPDPAAEKSPQEVIAALRDKTNSTEPSLPVLDMSVKTPAASEDELLQGLDADALAAEERRIMLEPRAPEPLSKNPADTQTIKALDSALRPDTQLLEALDMVAPVVPDEQPAPLGLQPAEPHAPAAGSGTEKLPTLSDSMRLDVPPPAAIPGSPKTPDINALEAALAVARKGPIALDNNKTAQTAAAPGANASAGAETALPAAVTPAPANAPPATPGAATPTSAPGMPAAAPANTAAATPPPAPTTPTTTPQPPAGSPDTSSADVVPEITLEDDMRRQQEAARARLAAEAAKVAAARAEKAAKENPPPTEAEKAAEAERASEKKRQAGMSSIAAQFSAGNELSLEDTQSARKRTGPAVGATGQTKPAEDPAKDKAGDAEDPAEQARLQKLANELGNAKSLEDIDDMAAETLFGEEFSQIAATVAAMAANDTEGTLELEAAEGQAVASAGQPGSPAAPAQAQPQTAQAQPQAAQPQATARPAGSPPTQKAVPAAPAAARPPGQRPTPSPADIDSSAARRLEMVRSLNKGGSKPLPNAMVTEDIVLGDDSSPTHSGPAPERIENQFGTSMTANLKALSEQSIEAMQKAEKQEEKKSGLLSRFKRS